MKKIKFMAKDRQTFDLHEPPIPAINGLPQWYKDIPAYKNTNQKIFGRNSSTVKQCLPLFDAMTAGYLVTLPCDIAVVRINGNQKVQWQPDMPLFDIENFERSHGIPGPLHHDPTIWRVVTYPVTIGPEGYSTFITGPINRFDLPFTVITGFVDSDTLHGALTVSLFFVMVICSLRIVEVGLNATLKWIISPFVMPPCIPPELFVFVLTALFFIINESLFSLPVFSLPANPDPISNPFTAGMDNIAYPSRAESLSKTGSPRPAGVFLTIHRITPPTESPL